MHVNRVAWVVVVLGALAALSAALAGVLGAHVFLLAAGTSGFTVAATGGALKLQARKNDQMLELSQEQLRPPAGTETTARGQTVTRQTQA